MKALVLDASVAAKWYLPRAHEDLVDQAFEVLTSHSKLRVRLIAPDFFWAEFGNVLWKAQRSGRVSEEFAQEAAANARGLGIAVMPSESLLNDALSIAIATGRALYDSLYVTLAIRLSTELITADERLVNALGARFPVRWLGRYDLSVGGL